MARWLSRVSVALLVGAYCGAPHAAQAQEPWLATAGSEAPSARWTSPPHEGSWVEPTWHALGLMTVMRVSAAILWPEPFAETDMNVWVDNYEYAFSHEPKFDADLPAFEWDGDPWTLNVIGHGAFGSELYLRPRICRKTPLEAALFTVAASATWEYLFEANAVQPSGLDIWFTPLAGVLLGEARYQSWRAAESIESTLWRAVVQGIVDPLGELERALGTGC